MRYLLLPFAFLYHIITKLRNHLYNINYKKSVEFESVVISVGNLSVGGTGKTPMVEYLINLLKLDYHVSTLSRGYGRSTKGFLLADESSTADSIGDEPMQYYKKYYPKIKVAVGEERALAIPSILLEYPETDLVLLDDAFQHRKVIADFNILMTDFNRPFYEDLVLPAGRLRESRKNASRADVVVVSKCTENMDFEIVRNKINEYTKTGTPVFFTGINYQKPLSVFGDQPFYDNILLLTGIAHPEPLTKYLKTKYNLVDHFKFSDHHKYTSKNIKMILEKIKALNKEITLLTTEKDMVRLISPEFETLLKGISFYYLPIQVSFLSDQEKFDSLLKEKIVKKKNSIKNES